MSHLFAVTGSDTAGHTADGNIINRNAPATYNFGATPLGDTNWNEFLGQIRPETIAAMPTQAWVGDPSGFYETARLAQMGDYASNPQFYRTRMAGFNPLYGRYMMGGSAGSFSDWMGQRPQTVTTSPTTGVTASPYRFAGGDLRNDWDRAVQVSQGLLNPLADTGTYSMDELSRRQAIAGSIQGGVEGMTEAAARQNALAIAAAGMGGGVGMGAAARDRALGRLYDLYTARAAAQGINPGGFLSFLGQRITPA